jgi:hypothetical protein
MGRSRTRTELELGLSIRLTHILTRILSHYPLEKQGESDSISFFYQICVHVAITRIK